MIQGAADITSAAPYIFPPTKLRTETNVPRHAEDELQLR